MRRKLMLAPRRCRSDFAGSLSELPISGQHQRAIRLKAEVMVDHFHVTRSAIGGSNLTRRSRPASARRRERIACASSTARGPASLALRMSSPDKRNARIWRHRHQRRNSSGAFCPGVSGPCRLFSMGLVLCKQYRYLQVSTSLAARFTFAPLCL